MHYMIQNNTQLMSPTRHDRAAKTDVTDEKN